MYILYFLAFSVYSCSFIILVAVTGKASDLYMFCPNSSQNFPSVEWLK